MAASRRNDIAPYGLECGCKFINLVVEIVLCPTKTIIYGDIQ